MTWGNNRGGGRSGNKKSNGATAGAFKTKKQGLYIAKFNGKYFDAAMRVFEQAAKMDEPGVVVFVNKNDRKKDSDPILRLGLDVDKPMERSRRSIRNDHDDEPNMGDDNGEQDDTNFDD
ncbi:MAG: hypothetical protein KGH87_08030 [Thaumarchaeota archaeon]|nr:hypothetical protein [Nitrososphaerota archaeon]